MNFICTNLFITTMTSILVWRELERRTNKANMNPIIISDFKFCVILTCHLYIDRREGPIKQSWTLIIMNTNEVYTVLLTFTFYLFRTLTFMLIPGNSDFRFWDFFQNVRDFFRFSDFEIFSSKSSIFFRFCSTIFEIFRFNIFFWNFQIPLPPFLLKFCRLFNISESSGFSTK